MFAVRRAALAALPVIALATAASAAEGAPVVQTQPCVPYIAGEKTMLVAVAGFTPGGFVTVNTASTASPAPRILTSFRLDGLGAFREADFPPSFTNFKSNLETFNMSASDTITNPAAPQVALAQFQVVRFGLTRRPTPKKPSSRVTVTARGFAPGKRVYAHFRFSGKTYRTVSLGIAKGVNRTAAGRCLFYYYMSTDYLPPPWRLLTAPLGPRSVPQLSPRPGRP